jgi:ABC-type nitrate/sulfonate/bicarbonate transport system substrate-binding protein
LLAFDVKSHSEIEDMPRLSRRQALLGAPALAVPALISRRGWAQSKRKVSFTLPWVAEGSNLNAYVAKSNGYWDELGLDVTISRGYGSVAAAQAVGAGQFDFGLAAASAGIQQAAKGLPVIAIACSGYDSTMGVGVLTESGITSPKELAGKTLGCTASSGEYPFLPTFFKNVGVDPASVKLQTTDANLRTRLLVTRQVQAISGYAISIAPVLAVDKSPVRFFLYSAYGLKQYNNMLLTRMNTVKTDPDLCRAVAAGLAKANQYVLLNPDASIDIFLKQVPEVAISSGGRLNTAVGLGIFLVNMMDDAAKEHGIGYSDPKEYETMLDMVMQYAVSPGDKRPAVGDLFTNDFIGNFKLTPDEWAKAEAKAQPYRSYLS